MKKILVLGAGLVSRPGSELPAGAEEPVGHGRFAHGEQGREAGQGPRQRPGGRRGRGERPGPRRPDQGTRHRHQPAALDPPRQGGQPVPGARKGHGDHLLRQRGDEKAGPGGAGQGPHLPQRDRRRPGHRPHVGHEDHPRRGGRRRQGAPFPFLLRRPAGPRGQRQPLRLQVLLEPARRGAGLAQFGPLPGERQDRRDRRQEPVPEFQGGGDRRAGQIRGLPQPRLGPLQGTVRAEGRPDRHPRHLPQPGLVRDPEEDRRPGAGRRDPAARAQGAHLPPGDRRPGGGSRRQAPQGSRRRRNSASPPPRRSSSAWIGWGCSATRSPPTAATTSTS